MAAEREFSAGGNSGVVYILKAPPAGESGREGGELVRSCAVSRMEEEERVGRSVRRRRREGVWSTNRRERAEEREVSSFARMQ